MRGPPVFGRLLHDFIVVGAFCREVALGITDFAAAQLSRHLDLDLQPKLRPEGYPGRPNDPPWPTALQSKAVGAVRPVLGTPGVSRIDGDATRLEGFVVVPIR